MGPWRSSLVVAVLAAALAACSAGDGGAPADVAPDDAQVAVVLGLARDDEGLAEAVRRSSDPASPGYGSFLTMDEVSERYGATREVRDRVLDRLEEAGVTGKVAASGGAVTASMSPTQVHEILGAWPVVSTSDDGWTVAEVTEELRVPDGLEGAVTEVVGARSTVEAPRTVPVLGAEVTDPCTSPTAGDAVGQPSALGAWYGFDDYLYRDQVRGAGRRVGVMAIGRWNDQVLDAFRTCFGTRPSGKVDVVEAPLTPDVPVGPEVSLDVVIASSFAPDAQIDVVQYDPRGSLAAGFLAAVDDSATGEPLDALSTSIGYCEDDLEPDERTITDHALLALAAVGTTVVASSGDSGAAGCAPASEEARVQYPASSPWIAGVGGTSVQTGPTGAIEREVVWAAPAASPPQAGGGGVSRHYRAPWYQADLRPVGHDGQRMVPDVAFLADPTVVPPVPVCSAVDDCTWYRLAGTSAPAPALAAALALVAESRSTGADQRRLGLLPPLVGQLAVATDSSRGVHDVVDGSNRVYGLACCDAATGFDLASGWGSVVLPALAGAADAAAGNPGEPPGS